MANGHQDENTAAPSKGNGKSIALAGLGIAIIAGAIAWGFFQEPEVIPPPAPEPAVVEEPEPVVVPEPKVEPEPVVVETVEEVPQIEEPPYPPEPEPVLALADSDTPVREAIADAKLGVAVEQFAVSNNVLQRAVSFVDSLSQGDMPYKLVPIARPKQQFGVQKLDYGYVADSANSARYDGLAKWIDSVDVTTLVGMVNTFEAPLNEAYSLLGYPDTNFRDKLVAALELIMLTPEPQPEAALVKKEAVYVYEDPELEALPALQKQVMRAGTKNADIIRGKAAELRAAILDS